MDAATPSFVARVDALGGYMPVQGEGSLINGERFYFRARHESWSFAVAPTREAAIEAPVWEWREPYGDRLGAAGDMAEDTARDLIESCAEMRAQGVAAPVEHQGASQDEQRARSLARMIVEDVALYHGDTLRDGGSVDRPIEEARAQYKKRTDPKWHALFDAEIANLRQRVLERTHRHDRWIRDEASARAVGRRWHVMLRRMPRVEYPAALEQGKRWLTAWTTESVREQALSEFLAPN